MSKKLTKIENEIIKLENIKSGLLQEEGLLGKFVIAGSDTPDSVASKIQAKEKEKQFELDRKSRLWYNKSQFQILITSIATIITTVIAAWIISKF